MNNDNHNEILGRIKRAVNMSADSWLRNDNTEQIHLMIPKRRGRGKMVPVNVICKDLSSLMYTARGTPSLFTLSARRVRLLSVVAEGYCALAVSVEHKLTGNSLDFYREQVSELTGKCPYEILEGIKFSFTRNLSMIHVVLTIMAQLEVLLVLYSNVTSSPTATPAEKRIYDMLYGTTYAYKDNTRTRLKLNNDPKAILGRVTRGSELYLKLFEDRGETPTSDKYIAPRGTRLACNNLNDVHDEIIHTRATGIWPLSGQDFRSGRGKVTNVLGDAYLYICHYFSDKKRTCVLESHPTLIAMHENYSDIELVLALLRSLKLLSVHQGETEMLRTMVIIELLISYIKFSDNTAGWSMEDKLKRVYIGNTTPQYSTYRNITGDTKIGDKSTKAVEDNSITTNRNFFAYFGTDGKEEGEIYERLLRVSEHYDNSSRDKRTQRGGYETLGEIYETIVRYSVKFSWTIPSDISVGHKQALLISLMDIYVPVASRLLESSDRMVLTMYKNVRNNNRELPFEKLLSMLELANVNDSSLLTLNDAVTLATVVDTLLLKMDAHNEFTTFYKPEVPSSESVIKEELETPVTPEEVLTTVVPLVPEDNKMPSQLPVMSGKFNMMFREYSSLLSTMVSWADSYCSKYGLDSEVSEHVAVGHILTGIVAARMSVYEPDNMTPELKEDVFRARYALAYLVVTNSRSPTTMLDYGKSISYASTVSSIDLINRILKALSAGRLVEEDYSYCTAAMELLTNSLNN